MLISYSDACDARYGSSCYIVVTEQLYWVSARDRCEALGGHLATIENQEENDIITRLVAGKLVTH